MNRLLFFASLFLTFLLTGCLPHGNPKDVLDTYNKNVLNNNFSACYDLLSGKNQKELSKDEFIQLQKLNNEASKCNGFDTKQVSQDSMQSRFGYQNVIEFDVTEKWYSYSEDKEFTSTYKRYVVNDQGKWKIYNENNYKDSLAIAYTELGWMYLDGKGKTQNLTEAERNISKAIEINSKYAYAHYLLGAVYNKQKKYDEAISQEKAAIENSSEDDIKSNAYNELGIAYQAKGDKPTAINQYKKALEISPSNEEARANLNKIQ